MFFEQKISSCDPLESKSIIVNVAFELIDATGALVIYNNNAESIYYFVQDRPVF